ncbi:ABC transporter permease [Pseudogemmobacter humi]|uniref:Osmoprotectant uptake system permease protein YehY n=1 Tax=Pseudogemmobacter humi TaxID=2483812 RepID=A0A3P5X8V2_9RHOB|nr:ABC transporter permease [Pseudogemmobacter humi]VDC26706.1 Putative osmoprotectant uptake system permease protein YehY [Pseudogemmobacter humi]
MTDLQISATGGTAGRFALSRTGLLFAALGAAGLALPLVQFKPNRIVLGDALWLPGALPFGWLAAALIACALFAALPQRLSHGLRLALAVAGLVITLASLGLAAKGLMPEGNRMARVAPAAGFWLLFLAFALMAADALARMRPGLKTRWAVLAGGILLVGLALGSGLLDQTSVMVEYAARADLFGRSLRQHLLLAFGSLGMALVVGLPLGILAFQVPALRRAVLSVLNLLQTIPSLALFGIMIPLFGWVAANIPGAAQLGVAGIGIFPALMALFFYSLLPVVSNTLVGLTSVAPEVRDAAFGLGMTRGQVLARVQLPLALPVVLAAVRIVLVQNIGLAVIAGLIGGGGFGTFVFQGLNQTAMDLILLGALPTIFLALIAGIALDLSVEALSRRGRSAP